MTSQLNMFSGNKSPSSSEAASVRQQKAGATPGEEGMVRMLEATGRYRILRKLVPCEILAAAQPGYPLKGIIRDTATTGLDARQDEVIEIGVTAFTFNDEGEVPDVAISGNGTLSCSRRS